jgi:hypothetical protein
MPAPCNPAKCAEIGEQELYMLVFRTLDTMGIFMTMRQKYQSKMTQTTKDPKANGPQVTGLRLEDVQFA